MDNISEKFHAKAKSWAAKNNLHGPSAFLRFVIFTFLECLLKESDQFILKGGNLLWIYIKTPRHTVDLDLVTTNLNTTSKLRKILEDANQHALGIQFKIKSIKEISKDNVKGAAVTIQFLTNDGATNSFDLDILYSLKTNSVEIPSPISPKASCQAASLENIVADKIAACHRFAGGNTRMKDFDDLWRLSSNAPTINWSTVEKISNKNREQLTLKSEWINEEIIQFWQKHRKRYKDLPLSIQEVISEINQWIGR